MHCYKGGAIHFSAKKLNGLGVLQHPEPFNVFSRAPYLRGCRLVTLGGSLARLNFEDRWWEDERRYALAERLGGSLREADGLMAEVWLVAQRFWGNGRKKVPAVVFQNVKDFELLFDVDLAYRKGSLIYVRGTRECHEWYAKRLSASASGGNVTKKRSSKREANVVANGVANDKQTGGSPAPVPAPVPTLKEKNEIQNHSVGLLPSQTPTNSPSQTFVATYVKAFRKRYGEKARPSLDGKVQGGIKRLLATEPIERACEMIQVFLQMDDQWFVTKAHDFETFAQNLTKVGLALDTGKERGGVSRWEQEMLDKEKQNDLPGISGPVTATQELLR